MTLIILISTSTFTLSLSHNYYYDDDFCTCMLDENGEIFEGQCDNKRRISITIELCVREKLWK